jgi:hypothetical protein
MGYSHYWDQNRDFTEKEWKTITRYVRSVAKVYPNVIGSWDGSGGEPLINDDEIALNGIGDDSHESLNISRKCKFKHNFIKTNRKPYDVLIRAILGWMYAITGSGTVDIRSDGGLGVFTKHDLDEVGEKILIEYYHQYGGLESVSEDNGAKQ